MKWTPDVIIASIVIVGGMVLRVIGIDAEVWALVLIAAGCIFGAGYQSRRKP